MLNNVEQCWTMLNNVEQCWIMLNNVEQCWTMLNNVEQCWTMLNNVERCWTMLNNVEQCWTMLNNVEQCWTMLNNVEQWFSTRRSMMNKCNDVWQTESSPDGQSYLAPASLCVSSIPAFDTSERTKANNGKHPNDASSCSLNSFTRGKRHNSKNPVVLDSLSLCFDLLLLTSSEKQSKVNIVKQCQTVKPCQTILLGLFQMKETVFAFRDQCLPRSSSFASVSSSCLA